ncbi:unnamed protein product [Amoebophrya sp. A25]|nr:unnamed protein product [Amoebophrya sp. A25]|eukprot:GSA25T00022517001.1
MMPHQGTPGSGPCLQTGATQVAPDHVVYVPYAVYPATVPSPTSAHHATHALPAIGFPGAQSAGQLLTPFVPTDQHPWGAPHLAVVGSHAQGNEGIRSGGAGGHQGLVEQHLASFSTGAGGHQNTKGQHATTTPTSSKSLRRARTGWLTRSALVPAIGSHKRLRLKSYKNVVIPSNAHPARMDQTRREALMSAGAMLALAAQLGQVETWLGTGVRDVVLPAAREETASTEAAHKAQATLPPKKSNYPVVAVASSDMILAPRSRDGRAREEEEFPALGGAAAKRTPKLKESVWHDTDDLALPVPLSQQVERTQRAIRPAPLVVQPGKEMICSAEKPSLDEGGSSGQDESEDSRASDKAKIGVEHFIGFVCRKVNALATISAEATSTSVAAFLSREIREGCAGVHPLFLAALKGKLEAERTEVLTSLQLGRSSPSTSEDSSSSRSLDVLLAKILSGSSTSAHRKPDTTTGSAVYVETPSFWALVAALLSQETSLLG